MSTPLVGRAAEQAMLLGALDAARAGAGRAVLVAGEPGVGKSMLLAGLAAAAQQAGCPVLRGRAVEGSGTFRPFAEAVLPLARAGDPPDPAALRPYRAALGRLVPEWSTGSTAQPDLDPVVVLGEGLLRLLAQFAPGGCVLLLEDLHWADAESLALVDYLSEAVASAPVLLLASTRDRAPAATHAKVIELSRLDRGEVDQLIDQVDPALGPADRTLVWQRSEGLPLLVAELLADRPAHGSAGWRVPASFAALVEDRLAALGEPGRSLLAAAAALGPDPDWDLVPAVGGVDGPGTVAGLREAVRLDLLVSDGATLSWRHVLTRDAIWVGLLPPERTALCRRAADVLLARGGPAAEVAAAELLIDAGATREGSTLLLREARRQLAGGAVRRAATLLDRVEATGAERVGLADARVEQLRLTGRLDDALATGTAVLDAATGREHSELCLRLARVAILLTRWADAEAYVHRARRPDDPRSLILLADAAHGAGDVDTAGRLAARAVEQAQRTREPAMVCEALVVHARILRLSDEDEAERRFRQAAELAAEHGLKPERVEALIGTALVELLRDERSATFGPAYELATDLGLLAKAADLDLVWTDHLLLAEGPAAAARQAERLTERGRLLRLPIPQLVGEMLGTRTATVPGDLPPDLAMHVAFLRAIVALTERDLTGAAALLDAGTAPLVRHRSVGPLPGFGLWALLRTVTGGPADRTRATVRGMAAARRRANAGALAYAEAVAAGRAGARAAAEAAFAAGETALAPLPWWHRLLRLVVLECAITDGWGNPVPLLRADLTAYEAGPDERLARTCRDLLRRAGAPTRRGRGAATVPAALRSAGVTSRELDVLERLTAGSSNAEVAEQLFLSVRTVETHVASLLARAGVRNRAELRAWYLRLTR